MFERSPVFSVTQSLEPKEIQVLRGEEIYQSDSCGMREYKKEKFNNFDITDAKQELEAARFSAYNARERQPTVLYSERSVKKASDSGRHLADDSLQSAQVDPLVILRPGMAYFKVLAAGNKIAINMTGSEASQIVSGDRSCDVEDVQFLTPEMRFSEADDLKNFGIPRGKNIENKADTIQETVFFTADTDSADFPEKKVVGTFGSEVLIGDYVDDSELILKLPHPANLMRPGGSLSVLALQDALAVAVESKFDEAPNACAVYKVPMLEGVTTEDMGERTGSSIPDPRGSYAPSVHSVEGSILAGSHHEDERDRVFKHHAEFVSRISGFDLIRSDIGDLQEMKVSINEIGDSLRDLTDAGMTPFADIEAGSPDAMVVSHGRQIEAAAVGGAEVGFSPAQLIESQRAHHYLLLDTSQSIRRAIAQIVGWLTGEIRDAPMVGITELRLSPEELGAIKIEMLGDSERMRVVVTAERFDTLELLRRNMDRLTEELYGAGFQNVDLNFGRWSEGSDQGARPEIEELLLMDTGETSTMTRGVNDAELAQLSGSELYIRI